jgi:adenylyl-sulfate kinase
LEGTPFPSTDASSRELSQNLARVSGATQPIVSTGERGGVLWMTGLSGAGKSTLAHAVKERLEARRCMVVVLDGDILRTGLNSNLGFSHADRLENVRRTAEVAALFKNAGFVVIGALISPAREHRSLARSIVGERFFEVHIASSLAVCESRDPKGLYSRARRGELPEFTGISSPYEAPVSPDLTIDTAGLTIDDSVARFESFIQANIAPVRFAV